MARKGAKASVELRNKLSEAQRRRWARNREMYLQVCIYNRIGTKHSEATRKLMSESHKRLNMETPELRKLRAESMKATFAKRKLAKKSVDA